jgi:hypothetical protein
MKLPPRDELDLAVKIAIDLDDQSLTCRGQWSILRDCVHILGPELTVAVSQTPPDSDLTSGPILHVLREGALLS